jgi:hypothetical protein
MVAKSGRPSISLFLHLMLRCRSSLYYLIGTSLLMSWTWELEFGYMFLLNFGKSISVDSYRVC